MKKIALLLLVIAVIGVQALTAQVKRISGTVRDAGDNSPIPGVSVVCKGTSIGTITNTNGAYQLDVPNNATALVFSFVGMKTQEIPITGTQIDVKMGAEVIGVDEVLVVAYGTAKKESFTGSAEVISPDKLQKRTIANVSKALDGMVAGVQTTSGSGQPGSGSSIVIRGFGSIQASNNPLYVVDGIPYDGNISAINPNDIESLTILKDASAGALYGARGANGVILITTKRGEKGALSVDLKANWGISSRAVPRYEVMDEKGYLETIYQSYRNEQITNGISPDKAGLAALAAMKTGAKKIFGDNEMYNPFNYTITELIDPVTGKVRSDATLKYSEDWLDEVTAQNPLRQEYILGLSGSNDKTRYLFSLGFLDEEGLLKTTNFKRYTGRINVDSEPKAWMKMGLSSNFSLNTSNTSNTSTTATSNVFYSAQLMAPIFPVYLRDAEGNVVLDALGKKVFDYGLSRPSGASGGFNSVATLYEDKYSSNSDNVSARTFLALGDLKNGPLQGLKLSVNLGFDYVNSYSSTYYNPYFGNSATVKGMISKTNARTLGYTLNELLTWTRAFGQHHVDVLAGHEYYDYKYNTLGGTKTGFPFGGLYELDAATTITDATSYEDTYRIESVLTRANYDFANKYYLSASFRTDGSSRFNKDYRWGKFWSVGATWRISEELFMQDLTWLNNLSLKASYGVQGNDAVGSLYAWQSFYDLGWPNANMSGAIVSSLENTNLKWEKNNNLNIGIEAKMFERFTATIELYERKTDDLLLNYPIASSLGFDGYLKNIGSMRNRGFDITLGSQIFDGNDFQWKLTLLASAVRNKVLQLADKPEIITGSYIIKEGEVLNSFYVSKSAGVDPATGQKLYYAWDLDEDGNKGEYYVTSDIDKATASKEISGNRIPDVYGSVNNDFKYKNFDLSIMTTYSIGGKILDGVYRNLMYGNYVGQASHVNRGRAWKQPGDITDVPKIQIGNSYPVTNDDLIDASYFSIKNITLGYSLPSRFTQKVDIETVRFTATGDNLFLFTRLKGMDPQYNFSGGTTYVYTPSRTISFGVELKF